MVLAAGPLSSFLEHMGVTSSLGHSSWRGDYALPRAASHNKTVLFRWYFGVRVGKKASRKTRMPPRAPPVRLQLRVTIRIMEQTPWVSYWRAVSASGARQSWSFC